MIKRNLFEEQSGLPHHSRGHQMRSLVAVHNCIILLLVRDVCDGVVLLKRKGFFRTLGETLP